MFQIITGKNLIEKLRIVDRDKESLIKTNEQLAKEAADLRLEVQGLKTKRKIEEEDIKHMLKMKEEALAIEKQKFELATEKAKNAEVAQVKDNYRDKLEAFLVQKNNEGDKRFAEILERLPNVTMAIKQNK